MDSKEVKEALPLPVAMRLKTIGTGIYVKKVMGPRLLIKLVLPDTELDRYKKTLVIPKSAEAQHKPLPTYGVVVQIGESVLPGQYNEGDLVLFSKFAGTDFTVNAEDFRIIHIEEILCILDADVNTFVVPVKEE